METLKIHAYFICFNERLILPHLLKHYGNFCERITIIDNYSNDGSRELIRSFKNVNLYSYDSGNEFRDDYFINIKNNCWKSSIGFCDYVIVGDCDEFIYHYDIEKFFKRSKELEVSIIKPVGYHMVADLNFNLSNCENIFEVDKGVREYLLDKCLIFNPNKIKEINYSFGCHKCNPIGEVKMGQSKDLFLKHYKFVGLDAYVNKTIEYGKRMSQYNKDRKLSIHNLRTKQELIDDYIFHLEKRENLK